VGVVPCLPGGYGIAVDAGSIRRLHLKFGLLGPAVPLQYDYYRCDYYYYYYKNYFEMEEKRRKKVITSRRTDIKRNKYKTLYTSSVYVQ